MRTAAMMSIVESVDTTVAADDVLESLLEGCAPEGGMRRKMAEGLRQKQLAITDLVSAADGEMFQGTRAPR